MREERGSNLISSLQSDGRWSHFIHELAVVLVKLVLLIRVSLLCYA